MEGTLWDLAEASVGGGVPGGVCGRGVLARGGSGCGAGPRAAAPPTGTQRVSVVSGGAGVRVHPWEGVGTCGVMRRVGAWAGGAGVGGEQVLTPKS